jgi:hypothetical protein
LSESFEQVAPDRGQQRVAAQGRVVRDRVDDAQRDRGPVRHRDRDRAVELDHRGRVELAEGLVEADDAEPVGVVGGDRAGVAGGQLGLQDVRPGPPAPAALRARRRRRQRGQAVRDQQPVPAAAVLLEQRDRDAAGPGAGRDAGRLDLHQRDQPVRLRFVRRQRRQHPAQPHRLVA